MSSSSMFREDTVYFSDDDEREFDSDTGLFRILVDLFAEPVSDQVFRPSPSMKSSRVALDDEDVCCLCLVNFPDAAFNGCPKESGGGVCCCPCAIALLNRPDSTKKCPHCRALITGFRVVDDDEV